MLCEWWTLLWHVYEMCFFIQTNHLKSLRRMPVDTQLKWNVRPIFPTSNYLIVVKQLWILSTYTQNCFVTNEEKTKHCNRSRVKKNVLRLIWSGLNSSAIFDWAFTSVPLEYVMSHFKATAAVQNLIRFLCRVAFGLRWRLRVLT